MSVYTIGKCVIASNESSNVIKATSGVSLQNGVRQHWFHDREFHRRVIVNAAATGEKSDEPPFGFAFHIPLSRHL